MTGNLNVYYLVRDKPNFINNSMRSSLDFTVVETNKYYLYHFCCKGYMTWTDLSIKCFKLHEYEYLDHTYSPQPDKYPFQGNIKKKSKFVFLRVYRLSEIFFCKINKKLQNYIHGNRLGCLYAIISTATASVASMLEGPNHALILHATKGTFI